MNKFCARTWRVAIMAVIGLPFLSPPTVGADTNVSFAAQGRVEGATPTISLTVGAGGVLSRKLVTIGETVQKGAILAEFHCPEQSREISVLQEELAQLALERTLMVKGARLEQRDLAASELRYSKAVLTAASNEFERLSRLGGRGEYISKSEIESARDMMMVADAGVYQASRKYELVCSGPREEELKVIDSKIQMLHLRKEAAEQIFDLNCLISAPAEGTVLKWHVEPGEYVDSLKPQAVVSFANLGQLRVRAEVDEKYVNSLRVGQRVQIHYEDKLETAYMGEVVLIEGEMGKKNNHSGLVDEPFDRDVLEVIINVFEADFPAVIGLRVVATFGELDS